MSALTLSAEAFQAHLDEWGCGHAAVLISDSMYAIPTREYIENEFAPWAREKLAKIVGDYEAEDADCDDFADVCACLARMAHRKTLDRPRATAIAFGDFWYTREDGGDHAICSLILAPSGSYELTFFEPQGCEFVNLTQKEIESCVYVGF